MGTLFYIPQDDKRLFNEWHKFIKNGIKPTNIDNKIVASWERSRNYNVNPIKCKSCKNLSLQELRNTLKLKQNQINIIGAYMNKIYDIIKGQGYLLYLTDEFGNLIHIVGEDKDILFFKKQFNFRVGASWDEEAVGTTAVAIALNNNITVPYMSSEKYSFELKNTSCSAIPLRGNNDELIGILGLAANFKNMDKNIFGIMIAAQMGIENQIRLQKQNSKLVVLSNYYHSIFNSVSDAIITVDNFGLIKNINKKAASIINENIKNIIGKKIEDVLNFQPLLLNGSRIKNPNSELFIDRRKANYKYRLKKQIPKFDDNNQLNETVNIFEEIKTYATTSNIATGQTANYYFKDLIGKDKSFLLILKRAKRASKSDSNIFITGESGTGKELLAQSIHNESYRAYGPFVAINCGAIPHELIESEFFGYESGAFTDADKNGKIGKFELANGGTIFLDEIGEMPKNLQIRLLRVLQNKQITRIGGTKAIPVDVRIIAATNKNIEQEVNSGNFRSDLYYRLNVIHFHMPNLLQRKSDIILLVKHFIKKHAQPNQSKIAIESSVLKIFKKYKWPGNVRELENVIEYALVFSSENKITIEDLPDYLQQKSISFYKQKQESLLSKNEKTIIMDALKKSCNNISQAARILGISRNTLYKKIKMYNNNCSKN
ncbi:MAG: sigma 54-interacting transcriptional regulator [Bacteroidales bacterium]|nr:sigma 54-interacting transcriptional regulator [Bacteroidales bacterium]